MKLLKLEFKKFKISKIGCIFYKRFIFYMSKVFDLIVVGAGTAGCLLANRLSANGKFSVALLEAGGSDNYHWVHIPVGYLYCMGNKRTDWLYKTTSQKGLNGRALNYPRGKVMGGCSSINGMIYMRGQANDYDPVSYTHLTLPTKA